MAWKKSLSALGYDVLHQICVLLRAEAQDVAKKYWCHDGKHEAWNALKNLSGASRYFRYVTLPVLFKAMTIIGIWDSFAGQVEVMGKSLDLMTHVKRCKLRSWLGWRARGFQAPHDSDLPPYLPPYLARTLAQAIGGMDHLGELTFTIPVEHTSLFTAAFRKVILPRVDVLNLDPHCEFAIASCPNVETISTISTSTRGYEHHSHDVIKAAARAPKLRDFAMNEKWTVDLLNSVLKAMPGLTNLSMNGKCSDGFTAMATLLPRFANLQRLAVPDVFSLRMTEIQPSMCGNSYHGTYGEALRRSEDEAGKNVAKQVAQMVFPACKHLNLLWIDHYQMVEAVRAENGEVKELKWTKGLRESTVA